MWEKSGRRRGFLVEMRNPGKKLPTASLNLKNLKF